MTGMERSSDGLAPRRKRILFRAWHRGMREMDLLLGRFADARIADLSEAELDVIELLMDQPDRDLFRWITGEAEAPSEHDVPLLREIIAFHLKTAG